MTIRVRRISATVSWTGGSSGTISTEQLESVNATFSFVQRVSTCSIVTKLRPVWGEDDEVTVQMGVVGSLSSTIRFKGIIRTIRFSDQPRSVETIAYGYLIRAQEYENIEDPTIIGGLIVKDLVPSGGTEWASTLGYGYTATASQIVTAVLNKAGVPSGQINTINSSNKQYGLFEDAFVWRNGTNEANFDIQEAGETALSYIERYDEIDCEWNPGTERGGRYRTFETLGGQIYRWLVGGRPRSSSSFDHTFTEATDILDGQFERSTSNYKNYYVVTGYDDGSGAGPLYFQLPAGGDGKRTLRFSSSMLERGDITDPAPGMSCEELANAISLDFNREIVTGWITIFSDVEIGPGQTHQIDTPSHLPDRLGVGEPLWVQGVEISVDEQGFTQRISYIGGGVDSSLPSPP